MAIDMDKPGDQFMMGLNADLQEGTIKHVPSLATLEESHHDVTYLLLPESVLPFQQICNAPKTAESKVTLQVKRIVKVK